MSTSKLVSIVVPVLNEQKSIGRFVDHVTKELQSVDIEYAFIFIDDGSSDDTYHVIEQLAETNKRIHAISLSRNFGKEAAICAGIEVSRGDAVIVMDVDLQHPPELLPDMITLWLKDRFKVVEAKKEYRGTETWVNKIGSKIFYSIMTHSTGFDLDGATDYKLLDRQVVNEWKRLPERITFFRGMSSWLGFRATTINFSVPKRLDGHSNWNFVKLVQLAVNAVTSFSALPLYVVTLIGSLFFLFSIVLGLQTLYVYLSGESVDGFTTVILLLLIIGATLSMGIGILGIYVSRIYEEQKSRPRYIIEKSIFPELNDD